MLYEESSRTLEVRELARLAFRRNMELGMVAVLAGGVANLFGFAMRFNLPPAARPIIVAVLLATTVLLEAVFFALRRSPPDAIFESFLRQVESKRQAGAPVAALSRTAIGLIGLLALVFSLGVVMVIPTE